MSSLAAMTVGALECKRRTLKLFSRTSKSCLKEHSDSETCTADRPTFDKASNYSEAKLQRNAHAYYPFQLLRQSLISSDDDILLWQHFPGHSFLHRPVKHQNFDLGALVNVFFDLTLKPTSSYQNRGAKSIRIFPKLVSERKKESATVEMKVEPWRERSVYLPPSYW